MGTCAGLYADYIYLTSEDPGTKDVIDICSDIIKYIKPLHLHNVYPIVVFWTFLPGFLQENQLQDGRFPLPFLPEPPESRS